MKKKASIDELIEFLLKMKERGISFSDLISILDDEKKRNEKRKEIKKIESKKLPCHQKNKLKLELMNPCLVVDDFHRYLDVGEILEIIGDKLKFGDNFKKYIIDQLKNNFCFEEMSFERYCLTKNVFSKQILSNFEISRLDGCMSPEEILLVIAVLVIKDQLFQKDGRNIIIGHLLSPSNIIFSIFVFFDLKDSKWYCGCIPNPNALWRCNSEILIRSQIEKIPLSN